MANHKLEVTTATSDVWQKLVTPEGEPAGFRMRGTLPTDPDGVELLMEHWDAGMTEPPHSHPGDDMTVVVEGRMAVQYFTRDAAGKLQPDGAPFELAQGEVGYNKAGRIHDARYLTDCKLVFVHSGAFGFNEEQ
jgi:mannose-6-phosphate isomerase-like protein (cupin superfamily)